MTADQPPPVLLWQRLYCGAMAALYAAILLFGLAALAFPEQLAEPETSPGEVLVMGGIFAGLGLVLAALFGAGPFLPRRRWAWIYHLVLIALGMTSCCCLPATIPLLVFWIRPETQAWYRPA